MRHNKLHLLLLSLISLLATVSLAAEPVALVTDLEGKASRRMGAELNSIVLLDEVRKGETVTLEKGSRLVLVYMESGEEFALSGPAELVAKQNRVKLVAGQRPRVRRLLGDTGDTGGAKIKPINVAQMSLVMRGSGSGKESRFLNNTKTLESNPYFHWKTPETGIQYEFILADDKGDVILETDTATGFQLPEHIELEPGITYSWEADPKGQHGAATLVWGSFEVADTPLRALARKLRPGSGATFSERVVYATWLKQNELNDEARRYWSVLAKMRGDNPRLQALADR